MMYDILQSPDGSWTENKNPYTIVYKAQIVSSPN